MSDPTPAQVQPEREPCDCAATGRIWCCMPDRHAQPAPDALREAVRDELAHWPIGSGYYSTSVALDEAGEMADAVLAVVAKHRDAEVERLREQAQEIERVAWQRRLDLDAAQDRIARARYALLTVTGKSEALAILEGRDG